MIDHITTEDEVLSLIRGRYFEGTGQGLAFLEKLTSMIASRIRGIPTEHILFYII